MSSGTRPNIWGISSAGRALAWHARGHRFDPGILHQNKKHCTEMCGAFFVNTERVRVWLTRGSAVHGLQEGHRRTGPEHARRPFWIVQRTGNRPQNFYGFAAAKFRLDICGKLWYNAFCNCGYSTSASISAFQAEEVGSIPITRSKKDLNLEWFGSFLFARQQADVLQTGGGNATIEL